MAERTTLSFAVIGAQRAGSTHLAAHLARHPGLYLPRDEVPYFEDPFFTNTPVSELERALAGARPDQRRGIHRPELLHRVECASRLADAHSDMQVLAVLRNPIRRAISAHAWYVQFGLVPFESVELGLRRLLSGWSDPRWPRAREVLDFGLYADAITRFNELLGADRVFVCRQEELQRETTLSDSIRFLGLVAPAATPAGAERTNAGAYALARLRWLRARHRLAFSWDNQSAYTYRSRRWRRPLRGGVAAAMVGVDRFVLRPIFGDADPPTSAALLDELRQFYAADLANLARQQGWDLAAWTS